MGILNHHGPCFVSLRNRADSHDSFRRDSRRLCQYVRRTRKKATGSTRNAHKSKDNPHCGQSADQNNPVGIDVCSQTTLPVEFIPTHSAISYILNRNCRADHDADGRGVHQQKQATNRCEITSKKEEPPPGVSYLLNNWHCDHQETKERQAMINAPLHYGSTLRGKSTAVPLPSLALLQELDIPVRTMKHGRAAFDGSGSTTTSRRKTEDAGPVDLRHLVTLGPPILATDDPSMQGDQGGDDDLSMGSIDYPDAMMMSESSLGSSWACRPIDGEFFP